MQSIKIPIPTNISCYAVYHDCDSGKYEINPITFYTVPITHEQDFDGPEAYAWELLQDGSVRPVDQWRPQEGVILIGVAHHHRPVDEIICEFEDKNKIIKDPCCDKDSCCHSPQKNLEGILFTVLGQLQDAVKGKQDLP